jgi:hypothetical protein
MALSLAAAGAQKVCPQLGAAEAEQAGIRATGTDFSLAKGMPEGEYRSVPSATGFATIGIDMGDRHRRRHLSYCASKLFRRTESMLRLM